MLWGIIFFFYQNNREDFTNKKEELRRKKLRKGRKKEEVEQGPDSYEITEVEETSDCQEPTPENPFMNVLLTDDFSEKKKACNYT